MCFHVLESCSLHAFDKYAGLYKCANQISLFRIAIEIIHRLESVIIQRNATSAVACTSILDLQ